MIEIFKNRNLILNNFIMKNDSLGYTYENKRACLFCGKRIPDQWHKTIKYCPRTVLEDGTIENHKDDYHSKYSKPLNKPYKFIAAYHKGVHERIEALFNVVGNVVTIEDVDNFGIDLSRPFQFKVSKDQLYKFYFHEFLIEQLPNNQYKISQHESF